MEIIKVENNNLNAAKYPCPKCGVDFGIPNHKDIVCSICPSCFSNISDGEIKSTKSGGAYKQNPVLPLGISGTLEGKKYTIMSCVEKFEKGDPYAQWHEYSLLAEDNTYKFLSYSAGHWILLEEIDKNLIEPVEGDKNKIIYQSRIYDFFSKYKVKVRLAAGRFPYDVLNPGENIHNEYISPPYMLAVEKGGRGIETTFHGKYLKPGIVAKAFGLNSWHFPYREGVGACQPLPFGIHKTFFVVCNVVALLLGLLVYGALSNDKEDLLVEQNINVEGNASSQRLITPSFELKDEYNCLKISTGCFNLNNDWIETDISLVNEKNGSERSFNSGMEYYSGYDSDGGWSEGSTSADNFINSVEPGTYHLEVDVYREPRNYSRNINLKAAKIDPMPHNFLVTAGILALFTALVYFGAQKFESARHGSFWGDD